MLLKFILTAAAVCCSLLQANLSGGCQASFFCCLLTYNFRPNPKFWAVNNVTFNIYISFFDYCLGY